MTTQDPLRAAGDRLIGVDELPGSGVAELPGSGVAEVEPERFGTLAVGLAGEEPFAVSNVCRHQFAKLGQGWVDAERCLVCPWHRARYDIATGAMVDGPQGRIFGFPPYSRTVQGVANAGFRLTTHPVELREGAIYLKAGTTSRS